MDGSNGSANIPKGSRDQFLEAYDHYAEAIYRHCYFRVFSAPRAEELVQDVFLKAWQYLGRGNRVVNMRALLYRIATNLVIDESRRRKAESLEALLEQRPEAEPGDEGGASLERRALARQIIASFSQLNEEEERLLVLRYVDDLDPREIAEILETNANNISVKLNHALQKVKAIVHPEL